MQIKGILDEILEKLPEEFNMIEIMSKVPVEERTPYIVVAFQECERMNLLTSEIRRSLKELDLGLKVNCCQLPPELPFNNFFFSLSELILALVFTASS